VAEVNTRFNQLLRQNVRHALVLSLWGMGRGGMEPVARGGAQGRAAEHRKLSAFSAPCQRTRGIPGRRREPGAACRPRSAAMAWIRPSAHT